MSSMQVKIDVTGLKEIQDSIKDFSDRRLNSVVATALTRTAKAASLAWQEKINRGIDRPTPRTQSATAFTGAKADRLESTVFLKDTMQGTAPSVFLAPQVFGGGRLLKKFEQALIASGAMPQGFVAVPGKHAQLDSYGNVSRGQLVAVIRALGQDYSPGYQRVISKSTEKRLAKQAKHGRQYIAVPYRSARFGRVSPGVYERMQDGSRKAIFLFKAAVKYQQRLSLTDADAVSEIQSIADAELSRALNESLARLAAKGGKA